MDKRTLFHRSTVAALNSVARNRRTAAATFAMIGFHEYWRDNIGDDARFLAFCGSMRHLAYGQILQDLWVLYELDLMSDGYFVEFGAFDGEAHSNTKLLESRFGWSGLLAEPNPELAEALRRSRSSIIDDRCVWDSTGEEVELLLTGDAELSTVVTHAANDLHSDTRRATAVRTVRIPTVSLNDLLDENGAPEEFEFMSVDTEGTELRILEKFDFSAHRPYLVAVEHNRRQPDETRLDGLMASQGYERRFRAMSDWDGWYRLRR